MSPKRAVRENAVLFRRPVAAANVFANFLIVLRLIIVLQVKSPLGL